MEHLDFPSQGVPFELFDRILDRSDGQIGDQLPVNLLSVLGFAALMARAGLSARAADIVSAFLSAAGVEVLRYLISSSAIVGVAIGILHFDAVPTSDLCLCHVGGDRMVAVACQAIDAGPEPGNGCRSAVPCRTVRICRSPGRRCERSAPVHPEVAVDCFMFSSQRMLSFFSIGMRVG